MTKITETNSTRLSRAPRVFLIPLICTTLAACGVSGSGGTTISTPAAPQAATVNCYYGATAEDGTRYTDSHGAPKCFAHLLAELHDRRRGASISPDTRGVAFIYDNFFDPDDEVDQLQLIDAGGLDGSGNYFLTASNHERLDTGSRGAGVRSAYNAFAPYLPAAVITPSLSNTGTSADPDIQSTYSGAQVRQAYAVARGDYPPNTLFYRAVAIYNFSQAGSHDLFYQITNDLTPLRAFAATSSFSEIPRGLIGVGALGDSNEEWRTGFRKQSSALLAAGYFVNGLTNSNIAARIDDKNATNSSDGVYWDSVEVDSGITDLIARTPTTQLAALVNHNSWETPADLISSAFSGISGSLATKVSEAGQTRLRTSLGLEKSLLDLLAGAAVHARTGHFYTASTLNTAGNDHRFNTDCGVLQDGCFVLPDYGFFGIRLSTVYAAPRLTAVVDTLWSIWPNLTNLDMHRLLRTCASDLGAPGVDPVFGQGLLDLECLVQPGGGLRIPTAQVAGIRGSLIGPSTADTTLATQDDFGRSFNYTASGVQPTRKRTCSPLFAIQHISCKSRHC